MISIPKINSLNPSKYSCLCLNYFLPEFFPTVWNNASYRIAADGGTNRLVNFFKERNITDYKKPNFISGDFDSIKPEIKEAMAASGVEVIETQDQDYCDSQKALMEMVKRGRKDPVVFIGCYGGRFDQTAANLHTLLWFKDSPAFMYDTTNIMFWVKPEHKLVELSREWCTYDCSILPFHKPVSHIETKGLKHDLRGKLDFMKSPIVYNKVMGDKFSIKTSDPVLVTCKVRDLNRLPK